MNIKNISLHALCLLDRGCDYVPVLSFFTNAADGIIKGVIKNKIDPLDQSTNVYYKHLKNKNIRCIAAAIPLAGNAGCLLYDSANGLLFLVRFAVDHLRSRSRPPEITPAEEIGDLKSNIFSGSTKINYKETNEEKAVSISGRYHSHDEYPNSYYFKAEINNEDQTIDAGTLAFEHYQVKDGQYWTERDGSTVPQTNFFNTEEKLGYIDITWIIANDQYKGLGKDLIKLAIEMSFKLGCEGRVVVGQAAYTALGFYYKMGFRSIDQDKNEFIENNLLATNRNDVLYLLRDDMDLVDLYLPIEAINEFSPKTILTS